MRYDLNAPFDQHGQDHGSHFNPNQRRVPAGNPDGGQWTTGNASAGEPLVRLAGGPPSGGPRPEIPKKQPSSSRDRTRIAVEVAYWLATSGDVSEVIRAIEAVKWLRHWYPLIRAYNDPPKSLEDLQRDPLTTRLGYDVHHIVEQGSSGDDGFARSVIDAPDNLVRIPRLKHWQINRWYQKENADFDGHTPRDYLRGRSWAVRRKVGLDALRDFGVLKP